MTPLINFAAACQAGVPSWFLGLPTWYKYLDSTTDNMGACVPLLNGINDVWLILAAVIEILLRVAAIAAIVFVVWGGIEYIMSQGEPERTKKAQGQVVLALIGLVIAIVAITVVSYIARKF